MSESREFFHFRTELDPVFEMSEGMYVVDKFANFYIVEDGTPRIKVQGSMLFRPEAYYDGQPEDANGLKGEATVDFLRKNKMFKLYKALVLRIYKKSTGE